MKHFYTFLLCIVTGTLLAQDTASAPIIYEPFDVKTKGFWVAASYGYSTRSFMPDFYQPSDKNLGHFEPKAYLAGSMPMLEAGYAFNQRIGVYAAFALPITLKHVYSNTPGSGHDQAKGWYASLGGQFRFLNKNSLFRPYLKAAFNAGAVSLHHRWGSSVYEHRGGYMLGGTIALGTDIKVIPRLYATVEAAFSQLTYQPKEYYNANTGKVTPYSTDVSDGYDPNYGWVYTSQNQLPEHFPMGLISFRAGLRYNLFGN